MGRPGEGRGAASGCVEDSGVGGVE